MRNAEINGVLSKFSLFRDLTMDELEAIVNISIVREWVKGSHVFLQDDPIENVYFIHTGRIKIYKTDINGKEQIVAFLKKEEMFPHVGFFRKGGYPAFSEVVEDAVLIVTPINKFERLLIENPELCIKVFKVLGEKIIDLQDRLEAQILNNTYEQIIKLIVRLGRLHGTKLENGKLKLKGEYTNKDLANMIGTSRETVSRTLTKMKKNGTIEVNRNGDMIFDPLKILNELV